MKWFFNYITSFFGDKKQNTAVKETLTEILFLQIERFIYQHMIKLLNELKQKLSGVLYMPA